MRIFQPFRGFFGKQMGLSAALGSEDGVFGLDKERRGWNSTRTDD